MKTPDPKQLFALAKAEPVHKVVLRYVDTIVVLHDRKGYSFRDIAEWLAVRGVPANAGMTYRVYKKGKAGLREHHI